MKREALLRHLRTHGCFLNPEGKAHSLWCNGKTGAVEAVPRHAETPDKLVSRICRGLSVPPVGRKE